MMLSVSVFIGVSLAMLPTLAGARCPLYRTEVYTRVQCETLCRYISICVAYTFNTELNLCSVWDKEVPVRGVAKYVPVSEKKHVCSIHPCGATEVCVPVMAGTNARCLKLEKTCKCSRPVPTIGNASLTTSPELAANLALAEYQCKLGFRQTAGSDVIVCNGTAWTNLTLVCQSSRMSQPDDHIGNECPDGTGFQCGLCDVICNITNFTSSGVSKNATIQGNAYNDTIVYGCVDGCTKVGDGVSVCLENSTWSTPNIACKAGCGQPNYTSPRVLRNITVHDATVDSRVVYECKDGYTKIGDGISVCLANSRWSMPNITCLVSAAATCELPNYTSPGVSNYVTVHDNKTVMYGCTDGYRMVGDGISDCLENSTWSTPNITCKDSVVEVHIRCGSPNYTAPGVSENTTLHDNIYNSTLVYDCMVGYSKAGDGVSVCLENSTWSTPNITCRAGCGLPNYTSPRVLRNITVHDASVDSRVVYECKDGYTKFGDGISVCLANSRWSMPNITCLASAAATCELPNYTAPGVSNYVTVHDNKTVMYGCTDGYRMVGDGISDCLENSTWSTPNITCKENSCSESIWQIANATLPEVTSRQNGATVTYSCMTGYNLTGGNVTSFCQPNGHWSKPTIQCTVVKCTHSVRDVIFTTHSMTSSSYGSIVTYSCVKGYKYYGGNGTSVCQSDGNWSKPSIRCGMWKEWAARVLDYSSQYSSPEWYATQILGKYNVYPEYGDNHGNWAPLSKECPTGKEWISVGYNESLYIHHIHIYETMQAGLVQELLVGGADNSWSVVWSAKSVKVIPKCRIFSPRFRPLTWTADRVKLVTNCTGVYGWVEFDAIQIVGLKAPPSPDP